jgi:hypothetical protein
VGVGLGLGNATVRVGHAPKSSSARAEMHSLTGHNDNDNHNHNHNNAAIGRAAYFGGVGEGDPLVRCVAVSFCAARVLSPTWISIPSKPRNADLSAGTAGNWEYQALDQSINQSINQSTSHSLTRSLPHATRSSALSLSPATWAIRSDQKIANPSRRAARGRSSCCHANGKSAMPCNSYSRQPSRALPLRSAPQCWLVGWLVLGTSDLRGARSLGAGNLVFLIWEMSAPALCDGASNCSRPKRIGRRCRFAWPELNVRAVDDELRLPAKV